MMNLLRAFSAVAALESAYAIKYDTLVDFSEQQMVSCDTTNNGCNGGWMDVAFEWVMSNGGITTEDQYPYTSGKGSTGNCITSGYQNIAEATPKKVKLVERNSMYYLKNAVYKQPVVVAVQSMCEAFWQYKSGVVDAAACGTKVDHGVLVTGYDKTANPPYWIGKYILYIYFLFI
jgi:cathepsin L